MNRGGIGSASIILVFVVLCLTIFAVISLVPALTDRTLVEAEVKLVQNFFEADTLAEQILAEISLTDDNPENVLGIDIMYHWDWYSFSEIVSFAVPITDTQILLVEAGIDFDDYQIFTWRMLDMNEWEADESLNLWQGDIFEGW